MRLFADAAVRLLALGLTAAALAGCGSIGGGGDRLGIMAAPKAGASGAAADYPIVLGAPFTIDGELYTPADTLNYDVVGYAAIDEGAGVTLAHRTLPVPSYVEVTSLATGKTILARVERRGPMAGSAFVALSLSAAALLEAQNGAAVRVRRVNPPERDRAELRAGRPASDRMDTPKSLVEVLRRKLPATGAASLRALIPAKGNVAASNAAAASSSPSNSTAAIQVSRISGMEAGTPVTATRAQAAAVAPTPDAMPDRPASQAEEGFVVLAGTFSVRANAERAAEALGGTISESGTFYRVRTGPFTSRGQAEAALAKVRAAGYRDARVYTAG